MVDLTSLTETLFESELFGHKKGAFTNAYEDKTGRFSLADKGTLFLDEIGNIPMNLQSKILTVLQTRIITPVGSNREIPVDFRLDQRHQQKFIRNGRTESVPSGSALQDEHHSDPSCLHCVKDLKILKIWQIIF